MSVNNKLNNSFDSEIVDTRVGYLHGVPVTYDLDENAEKKRKVEKVYKPTLPLEIVLMMRILK
ncbi:hypothetical protein ACVQ9Z_07315 [Staphylococcus aureus]